MLKKTEAIRFRVDQTCTDLADDTWEIRTEYVNEMEYICCLPFIQHMRDERALRRNQIH